MGYGDAWWCSGWVVYEFVHRESGKRYVGMTGNYTLRLAWHCRSAFIEGSALPLHAALREGGLGAFDMRILEECTSKQACEDAELWWIARYVNDDVALYNQKLTKRAPEKGDRYDRGNFYVRGRVTPRGHVDADMLVRMRGLRSLGVTLADIARIVGLGKSTVHLYVGSTPRRR